MSQTREASGPFKSLLVHVDFDYGTTSRVRLAARLAESCNALLIGAAACEEIYRSDGKVWLPADSDDPTRGEAERLDAQLDAAEAAFRIHAGKARLEWRGGYGDKTHHFLAQSDAADLLIVGRRETSEALEDGSILSVSEVAVNAGRPVLIVPPGVDQLVPSQVLVGWTNTREARRALRDSLPFLLKAQVLVVYFQKDEEDCDFRNVVAYLHAHDISCSTVQHDRSEDPAKATVQIARDGDFGLMVAGAYGHSQLRETFFGGVTRDLIETTPVPCLLSN